jgi:cytochrome d ubiquinol oxidase subunit I
MSVIVLGDESGYDAGENQKMKMAAIEAMWKTEPAPASFTLVGIPDQAAHETKWAIHIPYVMGLIGTRSLTQQIAGIDQLVARAHDRVRNGIVAYDLLMQIQAQRNSGVDPALIARFRQHEHDLGYALLLKTRVEDPRQATEEQIAQAAADTVPHVWPIFWAFRIMVGLGFGMLCMMGYFFWRASFRRMSFPRWALWLAVIATPAPWIAIEMGWIVAEYGRQPWTVAEVLPTALSVSHLTVAEVAVTLAGFVLLYSALFVVEMGLMFKYIRKGPHEDVALTEDWMRRHEDRLSGRAEVAK